MLWKRSLYSLVCRCVHCLVVQPFGRFNHFKRVRRRIVGLLVQDALVQMTISCRQVAEELEWKRNERNIHLYVQSVRTTSCFISLQSSSINFVPRTFIRTADLNGSSKRIVAAQWYTNCTSSISFCLSSLDMPKSGKETSPAIASIFSKIFSPFCSFTLSYNCA